MNAETLRKLQALLTDLEERAKKDFRIAEKSPDFYDGRASGYIHSAELLKEVLSEELQDAPKLDGNSELAKSLKSRRF